MLPLEREHRNARRKESDCENVRRCPWGYVKTWRKNLVFLRPDVKRSYFLKFPFNKKLNPIEPARTRALNENRMLGRSVTVCFAMRCLLETIYLHRLVEVEPFEMRYTFNIKTDLLSVCSKTRGFFWLKKPLCQIYVFFQRACAGKWYLGRSAGHKTQSFSADTS